MVEVVKIGHLDHLVLTVADLERTCQFYTQVLGMELTTFGAGRKALVFGQQKINVTIQGGAGELPCRGRGGVPQ